jgi:hypothetical protein
MDGKVDIDGTVIVFSRAPWPPHPDELFTYRVEAPGFADDPALLGFVRDSPAGVGCNAPWCC